jgi:fructoselysine-6-P-deglycase FrlB-like protein
MPIKRHQSLTDREIASQPETWARALAYRDVAERTIAAPGERILALGCGTSAFVAQCYASLREQAEVGETDWAYCSEAPPRRRYDRVVAITRSGTTTEVIAALAQLPAGQHRVVVTATSGDQVDAVADDRLALDFANEKSVVQTRFPTTTLTLMRAVLGHDVSASIADCRAAISEPLPLDPSHFEHFVYLGTGWTIGLANEAALKIRETAQAWSESYPAMDYRHGPIAAASKRSLVWIFGPPPAELVDALQATGATVVTSKLDPLAHLVQAQRLAVALAAHRGLDPDCPRALARSVILGTTDSAVSR